MASNATPLSNALFGTACLTIIALGALEIRDRLLPKTSTKVEGSSVEAVTDVVLSTKEMTVRSKGEPAVVMVELSDFLCPFCARYSTETYPDIQRNFVDTGRVAYAFHHFPMERLHPYAVKAAIAAECAGAQGRFWQMHESLFREQRTLNDGRIRSLAGDLTLKDSTFNACLGEPSMESKIRTQLDVALKAGVGSTPTFLIGTRKSDGQMRVAFRILGAQPYGVFSQTLNKVLGPKPE